ncbi:SusC/RagA family TonB-linked outer membrane protein [Ornithobacterium rhinotracheale]|uniref:SusC/RagA family TonB-linked outer membrane protein n=1 Tax=Ornithobacterium rhinotracheale TaxID=28251 RepID=UPI004036C1FA
MKLKIFIYIFFISAVIFAQKKIEGTVTDKYYQPIAGVNVLINKTTKGTTTNAEGYYSIEAKEGDVLEFKHIGYQTVTEKVDFKNQKTLTLDIILEEESVQLNEVVAVAFGKQKKDEITGAVQTLNSDKISELQNGNVVQGLSGKVAGVQVYSNGQPGSGATIRLRGIGSINASSSPLIVLDGVPYSGSLNSIAASDIANISFLQDASSNALYGARGANGVILVTTKRATKNGVNVELDVKTGVNFRAVADYDVLTTAKDYYSAYYQRVRVGQIAAGKSEAQAHDWAIKNLKNTLVYNAYDVPFDNLFDKNGNFNQNAKLRYQDDWREMFRPASRNEINLNVSGKSEKVSTYTSINYLNDKGYLINSGFERFGIRNNLDYKLTDNLNLTSNLYYTYTSQDNGSSYGFSNPFAFARNIAPFYPVYLRDDNFNLVYRPNGEVRYDYGGGEGPNSWARSYAVFENPIGNRVYNKDNETYHRIFSNLSAKYRFLKDFEFTYNFGGSVANQRGLDFGNKIGGTSSSAGGNLYRSSILEYNLNQQQLLTYSKKWKEHSFEILLGHEYNKEQGNEFDATKQELLIEDLLVFDNAVKIVNVSGSQYDYATEGYLSRLLYNYAGKYYFNANIRRDASSVFAPESRWGTFYGLGAAWNVKKEDFLRNVNFINSLRLKVSYGEQGNDYLLDERGYRSYQPYLDLYKIDNLGNDTPIVTFSSLGNRDLRWETSKNFNAGIESTLFNGRFSFSLEYFKRSVADMIYKQDLPVSNVGRYQKLANIGDLENKGVQFSTDAFIVKNDKVNWSVNLNATHYKNKIISLPEAQRKTGISSGGYFRLKEGYDRYNYYLRQFAGVDPSNGDALWYIDESRTAKTNDYSKAKQVFIGKSAIPKVYGGFGTDLNVGRFALSLNFAYQFGGWGFDETYQALLHSDNYGSNYHTDVVYNSWTPENTNAALPRIDNYKRTQNSDSDLFLIKSDYISLQNVSLRYTLPSVVSKSLKLNELSVYASGSNLYLWSKRKGYDPRLSLNGIPSSRAYSVLATVSLGLNVKF